MEHLFWLVEDEKIAFDFLSSIRIIFFKGHDGQTHIMQEVPPKTRVYDLEERALRFARSVRTFVKLLPHSVANTEDVKQLVRSSGAVGANHIEANQNLGKRDFIMRIKIAKKEASESRFWLLLLRSKRKFWLMKRINSAEFWVQ